MDELKEKIISMINEALDNGNLDLADRLVDMYALRPVSAESAKAVFRQ